MKNVSGVSVKSLFKIGICSFLWAVSSPAFSGDIADGSIIKINDKLSIAGIPGWMVERDQGMALVMKEIVPARAPGTYDPKPIFARNLTVMTLPEARPIDEMAIDEVKADLTKLMTKDSSLKDFQFTDAKLFDYKGKNDGLVLFSQLTVNGFQMMQMQVVVSGDTKTYLVTYSDLAQNFATPATYDAAWKSATSISVPGVAPRRFEKELMVGGGLLVGIFLIIFPFALIRWSSARRLKKMADELQHDWDRGESNLDYDDKSGLSSIGEIATEFNGNFNSHYASM